MEEYILESSLSGGQDYYSSPLKLLYKKGRLYKFNAKNRPIKHRQKGFWTRKKYPSYYRKVKID